MHGLLLVDKPIGLSSAAVVAKVKKHFGFKKVGHGGTLDPFASGLLVLLIGDGTKIARFLLEGSKTYEAEADLRFETDTGDNTGSPIETSENHEADENAFRATISQFCGTILQTPPMYSAIKKDGKPLYAYARAGKTVEVSAREVQINKLDILEYSDKKIRFRVNSSGGTYIRALAQDWARASGARAHLSALRRTNSHHFSVTDAHALDTLLSLASPPKLIPLVDALLHIPAIPCDPTTVQMLQNGQLQALRNINPLWPPNAPYAIALDNNKTKRIVAILSKQKDSMIPTIERVFDPSAHQA